MKLPDFLKFDPLVRAKAKMGIAPDVYGSFLFDSISNRLNPIDLENLISGKGIVVSKNDIVVLNDGTLAFKDSRILLYIRDINSNGRKVDNPKYHFFNCSTLIHMMEGGRFERYHVAAEPNGIFEMNIISGALHNKQKRRLNVCQNCLKEKQFDGFGFHWHEERRKKYVEEFTPDKFFRKYPRSLLGDLVKDLGGSRPISRYPSNFAGISFDLRSKKGWVCEACHANLNAANLRKYLHVHHKNGNRGDQSIENLKVVCLGCHANEPFHNHLKSTPDYKTYMALRQSHTK